MSKPFQTASNRQSDEAEADFASLKQSNSDSSNSQLNTKTTFDESKQLESLELQLSKADNLWEQGNISEAISLYCQAIELQPNSNELYGQLLGVLKQQDELALAYTRLAEQLKYQGETKDAAICYRQAIVLRAINERAQKNYQKTQKSALVFQTKSQIAPLSDSAFSFIPLSPQSAKGQILQISLDNGYRVKASNLLAKDNPKKIAKVYLQEALEYGDCQEWEQAATACRKAIDIAPDMAAAYKILGNAEQRLGNTSVAMECYAKALEIQPDLAEVYARIGSLYAQQKQWQPAIEYYQKSILIRPNFAKAYSSLAKIWTLVGEEAKAETCRQKALSIESAQLNAAANEPQSSAFEKTSSHVMAKLPKATTKINPVIEYQKLAIELEKQEKWQEAAQYYRKALELNLSESSSLASTENKPRQLPPQNSQTRIFDDSETEARERSLPVDSRGQSRNSASTKQLSSLNLDFNSGKETADTSLSNPSQNSSDSNSAVENNKNGTKNRLTPFPVNPPLSQLDKAIDRYLKQTKFQPNSAKIQTDLGNLYAKKRQWKIAIAAYNKAIKIDNSYAPAYLNLSKILAKLGKNRESIAYMYRALNLNPNLFSAKDYFYLGKSFIEQGKLRQGLSYCLKAIKKDPNYLEIYYHLGTVMNDRGQKQKAVNYFRQAIQRNPQDPQSHYLLGQILAAQSNWNEAVKAYRKVLTIQPEFPLASEKLNYALAEKLKQEQKLK